MAADYRSCLRCAWRDRALVRGLLAVLAINVVLVALHGAHFVCLRYGLDAWPRDPLFSLDSNTGLAQLFSSGQTMLLIGLLLRLGAQTRTALYPALAAVFLLVLLDDALALNQLLGEPLAGALGLVDRPRLEAQSVAEMMVYGVLALPLLGMLAATFLRAPIEHRRAGAGFVLLLALLAFFATVMDLVHLAFIKSFFGSRLLLEVVEEGGEMLTLSLALTLALILSRQLPARGAQRAAPAAAV
jgi:hypothetical protein